MKSFITSYYLKKLNFDINTVPVLDLPIKNTILIIKKRTFGPNINVNIILQKILIDNLSYFGLIPIMKHIPGHGVTNKDSHLTLPITKLSKSSLQDHIKIFKYFNKIPLAMTAHIKYLSWDKNNIATFSSYIIDNIIRKKIGYKGLIISDDLEMNANIYNIKDAIKSKLPEGLPYPAGLLESNQTSESKKDNDVTKEEDKIVSDIIANKENNDQSLSMDQNSEDQISKTDNLNENKDK